MRTASWIRITIIGPQATMEAQWDAADDWYALGGYRHPHDQQQARNEMATAELQEWLALFRPRPGTYIARIAALDPETNTVGDTWASVKTTVLPGKWPSANPNTNEIEIEPNP